ncbi:hypothetical protein DPMN_126208 [Dreissena polymorpha]|uniref:Uncharacterized protein n=1 Tax=Dreissena polymorpha TaxID=45954 RepID=A0A9D4JXX1_DREPO|nr:hypothetical protein DPMN_126208 [Dreissena polymorpha]
MSTVNIWLEPNGVGASLGVLYGLHIGLPYTPLVPDILGADLSPEIHHHTIPSSQVHRGLKKMREGVY